MPNAAGFEVMFENARINHRVGIHQKIIRRKLLHGVVVQHHSVKLRKLLGYFLQRHMNLLIELALPHVKGFSYPIYLSHNDPNDGQCG